MREPSEGDSVAETEARATRWPLRVRYHECDAQGVVFNANYFAWADMGSTEFWRGAFGGCERLVAEGLETVVDVRLEGKREPPPEVRAALERAAGA